MCGIAGILDRRGPVDRNLLDRLVASMFRRGPDGVGVHADGNVGLGMRRLAILDLEHGRQPFATDDGEVVAFVNGEIYNFRELRQELERDGVRFRTGCDAEVVPHAFRAFGPSGFAERLDGMFAIAVYERRRRRLHLVRDRFGEKPLFWVDAPGFFAFASQLTSLLLLPDLEMTIDPQALRQYLAMHFVAGSRTVFQAIRRVPPGHHMVVDVERRGPPALRRWVPTEAADDEFPGSYEEAVEAVRDRLREAVRTRLVAEVPVGVFLSGGIDSSALGAAAGAMNGRARTFSIGFEDSELDESVHAQEVAAHIGSEHHHFRFDLDACLDVLEPAIEGMDEPVGDSACLPVYLLSREARRHVKVVLSGEGADELFAGYGDHPAPAAGEWPTEDARFLRPDHTTPSGFPLLTSGAERQAWVPGAGGDGEDDWLAAIARRGGRERSALRRAQRADLATWLPDDLLPKLDHMTMAVSLEGRAPYLEPRLARLALSMPDSYKVARGVAKRVLRDAVAPWLPRHIAARPKQGFVLPMQRWLCGPLHDRLLGSLERDLDDGLGALDADAIRRDLAQGAGRARLHYALLAYREWVAAVRDRRTLAHRLAARADAPGASVSAGAGGGRGGGA